MPGLSRLSPSRMPRRAGRSRYQRQALTSADYQQQIIDSEEDKTMTDTQPKPDPQPPTPPEPEAPEEPEDEDQPEAPEEEDDKDKPAPA